jgi:GNAT superfamily N-acetyltransferase
VSGPSTGVAPVEPQVLLERSGELSAWCDLDPPTVRDIQCSLGRDLDQVCWLGPGGEGAMVVVPRWGSASVKFLAVPPAARTRGIGAALLAAGEGWAADNGCRNIMFGLSSPGYLWPGVELGLTSMETFLTGRGYREVMWAVNQVVDLPVELPAGRARVARPDEVEQVTAFCRAHYAHWETEARWSFDEVSPRCAVWYEAGELLGFACWSVTREGWFGPMATRPDLREGRNRRGIGTGTLGVALGGLAAEGYSAAEISWVGPERFYARVAGARAHRAFRVFQRSVAG